MNGTPTLRMEVAWAPDQPTRVVALTNTRPQAAKVLVGRDVAEALKLVPALFSVCGRAQSTAAIAACVAAGATDQARAEDWMEERVVAAETAQEHLWRLMLDWPALFGHGIRRERFSNLYRRLGQITARDARAAFDLGGELLDLVAVELLGGFFLSIREPQGLGEFVERSRQGGGIGAALGDLIEMGSSTPETEAVALMPALPATTWAQSLVAVPDATYCATPTLDGAARETGVLARHATSQLVRMLVQRGHRIAARLFARAVDLADCGSRMRHPLAPDMPVLVDVSPLGDGGGLACVETARGLLMHALRIEDGKIADYAIVAPTEWNFHPDGPFVREASGWMASTREAAELRLKALVLALDPCVEYQIVLREADDA
jgi:hypothetical protein